MSAICVIGFELMGRDEVSGSGQESRDGEQACPVFGVESGGPLVGLGVLLILFAIIPFAVLSAPPPVFIVFLFAGFGVFLMWAGITK